MANRIAGITVEIGGDTTKLLDALKGVNKSISQTQTALKDVNKLLKLDPGNVDLLQQKQKLLGDAIGQTEDKLKAEKAALEQLKGGEQTEETIRQQEALTREITDTEQQLKGLKEQYKDFGSVARQQAQAAADEMKKVGEGVEKAGEKITKAGAGMSKAITVPIAGAAAASAAAWNEVDAAMDTIVTKTGASGDALADMQARAKSIAKTVPTSFQTAADAVGEVNTRFGLTGEALEKLATQFVQFSALNSTDVSSSIDMVQSALAAFGLTADDAGAMLDVLNKAGQDTGVSVDALAGMLTANAAGLKEMGYSASDAAMLLANLSKNGIDSSAAMTGLKKAYTESIKEGKPMSEMLADLESRLQNADTRADAAADAIEIFGSRAGGQLVDALQSGRLSFDALGTSMSDFAGNVDSTFSETIDPLDQMTTTMNELKDLGAEIVESAGPMLTEVMQGLADVVHKVADAWNSLDEDQKEMIIKIAAVLAVVGPVVTIIGGIVSGIGSLIAGASALIPVIAAICSPVGLVIAAIVALIAAGVALYTHWDEFKQWAGETWTAIKDSVSAAWDGIKTKAAEAVENVKTKASEAWENIKTNAAEKWEGIKTDVAEKAAEIAGKVEEKLNLAKDAATNIFNSIKTAISSKIEAARDAVHDAIEKIKGFFDFSWSLPPIKLPHFSISGEFSLSPPSIPTIGVEWYKRAMGQAAVLNDAAIFGAAGGRLLGGGEAGPEVVSGEAHLISLINASVDNAVGPRLDAAVDLLRQYLPECAQTKVAVPVNDVDRAMAANTMRRQGAW